MAAAPRSYASFFTPPSEAELAAGVTAVKDELKARRLTNVLFASAHLYEPSKPAVLSALAKGGSLPRRVRFVLLDKDQSNTYRVIVNVSRKPAKVDAVNLVPDVQPMLLTAEYAECELAVKADQRVIDILAGRGITDLSLLMVEVWLPSVKEYPIDQRIATPILFVRSAANTNGYAQPVDGIYITVDMNNYKVLEVEDLFEVPVPDFNDPYANFNDSNIPKRRTDLKPLHITQPQGPSFTITPDNEISWQGWNFAIGWTPREGLVFNMVKFYDHMRGEERPMYYRVSCVEMVVPYGDYRFPNYNKNAFDAGEDGLGKNANSLVLGCDCVGDITYLDIAHVGGDGAVESVKHAICIHEEDVGVLWKHTEWRDAETSSRRARRLVISFFTTIANYDYGFYWYFYQDGRVELEVKLTGILSVSATAEDAPLDHDGFGVRLAPQVYGPIHQHFFTVRLDMAVDSFEGSNSVEEVDTHAVPASDPNNTYFGAYHTITNKFKTENDAKRNTDSSRNRHWRITNTKRTNRLGTNTAIRLHPHHATRPYADHALAPVMQRAAFLEHDLWVTPYNPAERFPAGDFPVGKFAREGLPQFTKDNRNIDDTDVVVWYTFGAHHVPRVEEWPVMPVATVGFSLLPDGFFDANPTLDLANSSECIRSRL